MSDQPEISAGSVRALRNSIRFPQLLRAPIFDGYSDQERMRILDSGRMSFCRKATDIFHQDAVPDGIVLIAQGEVEVTYISPLGARTPLLIAHPGMALGLAETLAELPCAATCRANAGTSLVHFDQQQLLELAGDLRFVRNFARNVYEAISRFNMFRAAEKDLPVPQRVAHYINLLMDPSGNFRNSQSFLADAVGCSRQSINKIVGQLRAEGIVAVDKAGIRVLDVEALAKWGQVEVVEG